MGVVILRFPKHKDGLEGNANNPVLERDITKIQVTNS